MKYKNMSISIIIPVVAAKGEGGVILNPKVKEHSKTIKYDEEWWSEEAKNKFFNDENPEEKIVCFEMLQTDNGFNLRKEMEIYKNKDSNYYVYSFCKKELSSIQFEISSFKLWQNGNFVFFELNLILNGKENDEIKIQDIKKVIDMLKNNIQKRDESAFFYEETIDNGSIVRKKNTIKEILKKLKIEFIYNNEKVNLSYKQMFILSYFVAKQEENEEENAKEECIYKDISTIYNVGSEECKYVKYKNLQYWVINKEWLSLFVSDRNKFAKIEEKRLYEKVFHEYMMLVIYCLRKRFEMKNDTISDNIKKWNIYSEFSGTSKHDHINKLFKKYLFLGLELDTIDKAIIPLDENIVNEPYIFISYSNDDYEQVYPIIVKLKEQGISVWYDEGLAYGESWKNQVRERLNSDNCKGIVFFSSANSFSSKSVIFEIEIVYDMCNKSQCSKDYFAVSLLDTENFNTTAILRETICKFNNEELGKVWGTEQIKCIIEAFPDEKITLSINKEGWFDKMKKTMKDYLDKNN